MRRELEKAPVRLRPCGMARIADLPPLPSTPAPGLYRHYKGALYEAMGVVRHSEDLSPLVLYRPVHESGAPIDGVLWVRPHAMWSEPVVHAGSTVPRFAPVG